MNLNLKTAILFFSLIIISILVVYFTPPPVLYLWFIVLLFFYWRSKDEPLWFALIFVFSDGFMGFFGAYQVAIPLWPGLPSIEIAQFYIILSVIKARNKPKAFPVFYHKYLIVMGIYVLFLIAIGFLIGINKTPNDYFRIVKLTLPLLLFYSVPRLITNETEYTRIFSLIFPIALLAFLTQMFDIISGQSFSGFLGTNNVTYWDVMEGRIYRVFYNANIILMALFGSLYYSVRKHKTFNLFYLYIIISTCVSTALFSATRGWIIAFGVILTFFILIMSRIKISRLIFFLSVSIIVFLLGFRNPFIQKQVSRSYERLMTMEAVVEGDLSAGGTATRATDQSQRVMNKWKESPIFGWGFSEEFRQYINEHVGNQNILLHSGIIGALLMFTFFYVFNYRLFKTAIVNKKKELMMFTIFFLGWFIIHSTSGQHFAYYQMPKNLMAQSLFFSYGALLYWNAKIFTYD
jgi:hypothetical protein